jgi:CHAD domain-containing protein
MPDAPSSYAVPSPSPPADEVVALLRDQLDATPEPGWVEVRAVLDSADHRLRAAGVVLEAVTPAGGGTTIVVRQWGQPPDAPGVPVPELPRSADDLPARVRSQVAEVLDGQPLERVGLLEVAVHPLAVRDDEDKAVVRAAVEVTAAGTWVRLTPVRGYARDGARAARKVARLGLCSGSELVELAYSMDPEVPIAEAPACLVWIQVLAAQLDVVRENLPGAIDGEDPEALHDLRVAVRRSRSALRHATKVLPPELLDCFRPELTELQRATGAVRDLDVLLEALADEDDPELAPLGALLRHRLSDARDALVTRLQSPETAALLDDWQATLAALEAAVDADEADEWGRWPSQAHRPVSEVAGHRIDRQRRRVLKRGGAIEDSSPPEDLHELRKQGKELRYLTELFGEHVPDRSGPDVVKALKRLQDVLGRYQDQTVQHAALSELRSVLQPAARPAVDRLLERIEAKHSTERAAFAQRFAKLTAAVD